MSVEELRHRLVSDLRELGLPIEDVDIYFRPFSKTSYGRYLPVQEGVRPKIYVDPFADYGELMTYDKILETAVHEFCHHLQYVGGHKRIKGVMHDTQFWELYNQYMKKVEMRLS